MKDLGEKIAAAVLASALTLGGGQVVMAGGGDPEKPKIENVSDNHLRLEAPLLRQGFNECGPTVLMMAMRAVGDNTSKERILEVSKNVGPGSFDPTARINPIAMSPDAMVIAAGQMGMVVEGGENKNWGDLYNWLYRGMPVVVDIVYDPVKSSFGHFLLVTEMDLEKGTITFNNSLGGIRTTMSQATFERLWRGPVDRADPLKPEGHSFWAIALKNGNGQIAKNYQEHISSVANAPAKVAP